MKLEKAIEIGTDILNFVKPGDPPDEHDALKLLIESGKRLQELRIDNPETVWQLLPGETEE